MDLAGLLADDWLLMDDARVVSYESKSGHGSFAAAVTVTDAVRRALDRDDLAVEGALLDRQAVVYHLWAARLGALVPKRDDRVTDGSVVRTVARVQVMDEGQRFRLTCLTAK